jgi:hypothetical protein
MQERRREPRLKVLKHGKVLLTEVKSVDCMVRDISALGARIEFDLPIQLPSHFRLRILSVDLTIPAAPVWQHRGEAGIRFVGVGTAGAVDNSPIRGGRTNQPY